MLRTTVHLPEDWLPELDRISAGLRLSRAGGIRLAIEEWILSNPPSTLLLFEAILESLQELAKDDTIAGPPQQLAERLTPLLYQRLMKEPAVDVSEE